jgi:hypothetical protein
MGKHSNKIMFQKGLKRFLRMSISLLQNINQSDKIKTAAAAQWNTGIFCFACGAMC